MRNGTPQIAALGRAFLMLEAILGDRQGQSIAALARERQLPVATAHRQVATLVAEQLLDRLPGGRFVAGRRLLAILSMIDEKQVIVAAAAPVLHRLARRVRSVVQLGTMENDMVTYRIKTGRGAGDLFTKVDMQLEAYCSGMGKVLLANLPESQRRGYLANGPFVALTPRTITDPARLSEELDQVCAQGFAVDDGEIAEGLVCVAVPIRAVDGSVPAAISVSGFGQKSSEQEVASMVDHLTRAAAEIEQAAFVSD